MSKRAPVKTTPPAYFWVLMVVVVAAIGYLLLGRGGSVHAEAAAPGLPPASGSAPAFTLEDLQGKKVALADFKGEVVVLDFWATWCPPCRREIPDFITLQKEYADRGVQIVGVALDEFPKVQAFVRDNGMNYPVLMGTDAVVAQYGGIEGIPTTFIIDRQGKIVERFEGFRPKATFEEAIKRLL